MAITWTDLKDLRQLLNLTQAELAEALGVHPKTIVNWESQGVPPKSEYKITRAFGDAISYVQATSGGFTTVTYPEWVAMQDADRAYLEHLQKDDPERFARTMESAEASAAYGALDVEDRQAAYEAQRDARQKLARFATTDLLDEVKRRVLLSESADVTPSPENEKRSDYARVARKTDPDRGEDPQGI